MLDQLSGLWLEFPETNGNIEHHPSAQKRIIDFKKKYNTIPSTSLDILHQIPSTEFPQG